MSKSISIQNDVKQNLKFQKVIVFVGILLFSIKVVAWYFTNSIAILTDTLESIVNIITSFVGLYSLYLSSLPKDENHPYGHGKVEFISAAIEGMLITVAGILIVFEADGEGTCKSPGVAAMSYCSVRDSGCVKEVKEGPAGSAAKEPPVVTRERNNREAAAGSCRRGEINKKTVV